MTLSFLSGETVQWEIQCFSQCLFWWILVLSILKLSSFHSAIRNRKKSVREKCPLRKVLLYLFFSSTGLEQERRLVECRGYRRFSSYISCENNRLSITISQKYSRTMRLVLRILFVIYCGFKTIYKSWCCK